MFKESMPDKANVGRLSTSLGRIMANNCLALQTLYDPSVFHCVSSTLQDPPLYNGPLDAMQVI